jgi:replicative DNA helicase
MTNSNGAATPSLETTREAEKRVLGAVLQGGTAVYAGLNTIIPDASVFSHEQFSVVWESAGRLHDRGQDVDTITVVAELEERGVLDKAGGAPIVRSYPSVLGRAGDLLIRAARRVQDTPLRGHASRHQ